MQPASATAPPSVKEIVGLELNSWANKLSANPCGRPHTPLLCYGPLRWRARPASQAEASFGKTLHAHKSSQTDALFSAACCGTAPGWALKKWLWKALHTQALPGTSSPCGACGACGSACGSKRERAFHAYCVPVPFNQRLHECPFCGRLFHNYKTHVRSRQCMFDCKTSISKPAFQRSETTAETRAKFRSL